MIDSGWLPPTPELRSMNLRYTTDLATTWQEPPATFEKMLPVPWEWHDKEQNQGPTPMCVGYSGAWGRAIDARIAGLTKRFDPVWLYNQACKVGQTKNGAYIWAACKVLQDKGGMEIVAGTQQGPDPEDKIKSYLWATSWRDVRAAIYNDVTPWFGSPWPWDEPEIINGEPWIGNTWGPSPGGHAYQGIGWSDKRNAAAIVNTWGKAWPRITWIGASAIQAILTRMGGEVALVYDQYVTPIPEPEPEPEPEQRIVEFSIQDYGYFTGALERKK